ncbi:IS3 family transposase [Micromonospora kangleipakensis]|uniref:IS3 family transposase n=1 Tax=Micromonospora kangleipakensis TaxID=1077942 RepID=UPI003BF88E92
MLLSRTPGPPLHPTHLYTRHARSLRAKPPTPSPTRPGSARRKSLCRPGRALGERAGDVTAFDQALRPRLLGVSTSGYYEWRGRGRSPRQVVDEALTDTIRQVHQMSRGTYGASRVHAELRLAAGVRCGRKRVARLMHHAGLQDHRLPKRHGRLSAPPTRLHRARPDVDGPGCLGNVSWGSVRERVGAVLPDVDVQPTATSVAAPVIFRVVVEWRLPTLASAQPDRSAFPAAGSPARAGLAAERPIFLLSASCPAHRR